MSSSLSLLAQNGNVGVGTTNPQAKLHVDGDVRLDDKLEMKNSSGNTIFSFNPVNQSFEILSPDGTVLYSASIEDSEGNAQLSDEGIQSKRANLPFPSLKIRLKKIIDNINIDANTISADGTVTTNGNGKSTEVNCDGVKITDATGSERQITAGSDGINDASTNQSNTRSAGQNEVRNDGTGDRTTQTPNGIRTDQSGSENYCQINKDAVTVGRTDLISLFDIQGLFNRLDIFGANLNDGNNQNFSANNNTESLSTIAVTVDQNGVFQFTDAGDVIGMGFDLAQSQIDFFNDLFVNGELAASTKLFRIDHPLDPRNKILQHVSIESPDMKNIYDGTITTDANGKATVQLPDYFEALNMDFRYQLTVIGSFAQAIISQEVEKQSI